MFQKHRASYLLLWRSLLLQAVQGVLHAGETPRQGQQQAHNLVQVSNKHAELVQLVGLTEALDGGLHLPAQGLVLLHVLLQAVPRLPQYLQLPRQAEDQLLLEMLKTATFEENFLVERRQKGAITAVCCYLFAG